MTKLSRLAPRLDRWLALLFVGPLALSGCSTAPPEGMAPVTPFDLSRYEGKWYELARLDHSFERGLSDVSAQSCQGLRSSIFSYLPASHEQEHIDPFVMSP